MLKRHLISDGCNVRLTTALTTFKMLRESTLEEKGLKPDFVLKMIVHCFQNYLYHTMLSN